MKRFFISLLLISFFFSFYLFLFLPYNFSLVGYHLTVMMLLYACVFTVNIICRAFIKNNRFRVILLHGINGTFFLSLCIFYILAVGSNAFWKKTITKNILNNYLANVSEFVNIMPVEKWIVATAALLLIILIAASYWFIKPTTERIYINRLAQKEKLLYAMPPALLLLLSLLAVVFPNQALHIKRTFHFGEEPLMQFALGEMWGEENDLAFDRQRYQNGLRDSTCTDAVQPLQNIQRPVVIILIDGLRNDHLRRYGYARQTTPFIDSLYASGNLAVVENAFSPSTMTIGGIAGLFFSKDWEDFGFNGLSLMKFMQRSGYTTYAYLTGFHRDWYGLSALYRNSCDYYYESSKNPEIQNDDDLVTLHELEKASFKKNAFIYLHLLSVHALGKRNAPFRRFMPDKIGLGTGKKEALINNYDNGILQADYVINRTFQKLRNESLLDSATIFVLSDHGEVFGEHDQWGHGGDVAEALVSIPMLIYDKNKSWYRNTKAATLKDVAPTIAARLGQNIPACWQGASLHNEAKDFSMPVNAVVPGDFPFGLLRYSKAEITLQVFDKQHKLVRTSVKDKTGWQETK